MRFKLFVAAAGLGQLVVGVASSAVGHHNSAGFDTQNLVNLRGIIRSVQWINPHAWIQIAVKTPAGGAQDWMIELAPPGILVRRGLTKDSLKAGTEIIIDAFPAKNALHRADGRNLTLPTGEAVFVGSSSSDGAKIVIKGTK